MLGVVRGEGAHGLVRFQSRLEILSSNFIEGSRGGDSGGRV